MSMRTDLLETLAAQIADVAPTRIVRIAIDGVDGAGKTTFADALAAAVMPRRPVIRASVDGFHHPRAIRYRRGRHSPEGFFRDSYDYDALRKNLLDPLGPDGNSRYVEAVFDSGTNTRVEPIERVAAPSAALLLDGIFLHRPELVAYWDASIFLRVDFAVSVPRGAGRDGASPDPDDESQRRYVKGQRLYFRECIPESRATIVVDYNDLGAPRIVVNRGA